MVDLKLGSLRRIRTILWCLAALTVISAVYYLGGALSHDRDTTVDTLIRSIFWSRFWWSLGTLIALSLAAAAIGQVVRSLSLVEVAMCEAISPGERVSGPADLEFELVEVRPSGKYFGVYLKSSNERLTTFERLEQAVDYAKEYEVNS